MHAVSNKALFLEKLCYRSINGNTLNSPAKRSGKAPFYIVATSSPRRFRSSRRSHLMTNCSMKMSLRLLKMKSEIHRTLPINDLIFLVNILPKIVSGKISITERRVSISFPFPFFIEKYVM